MQLSFRVQPVVLTLVLAGCGARTQLETGSPDASTTCFPPCIARTLATCAPPTGDCTRYVSAAIHGWHYCFANGHRTRPQGGPANEEPTVLVGDRDGLCFSYKTRFEASVNVSTWKTESGATIAEVSHGDALGDRWRVLCEGQEYVVDPQSEACRNNPWFRVHDPQSYNCPSDNDRCPSR